MKIKYIYLLIGLLTISSASAELTIHGEQIGNNVIFTYSGSINTNELTFGGAGAAEFFETEIEPQDDEISSIGERISFWETPDATTVRVGSMGSGSEREGSAIGDTFGVYENPTNFLIILEEGYNSGDSITGTITFTNTTFELMGVTENNTVTYSWGSGSNADSIIFSTVPEEETPQLIIETAILLHFESKVGSTYTIEESTDLENWEPVVNNIQGDGSVKKYFFETSTPKKFYRIQ